MAKTNTLAILKDLNEEQRAVVKSIDGSYFVLSGPGSGKTRCLVSRTQYMLCKKIAPESILLFTFTNKAANEIRERIKATIDEEASNKITIGTYHSICLKILKLHYKSIGVLKKNFSVYDQDDTYSVLKKICTTTDVKQTASYISHCKDNLIGCEEALIQANTNKNNISLAQAYCEYQNYLIKNNAVDFDDIIFYVVKLLENNNSIRTALSSQYRYITSDETQDASISNIRLLELLAGLNNNVCMFLDDDQSIYGFRGANVENVLRSTEKFCNTTVLSLNRNYRSTQNIVNASVSVINNNNVRVEKPLFTQNQIGEKVFCFQKYNKDQEAERISELIKFLHNKCNLNYENIAVLYRNNSQSTNTERALLKNNIPYEIKNNIAFCERKEIKDLMAYLRLITNPYDYEAFKRVVNIPKRGIGASTVEKVLAYLYDNPELDTLSACKEMVDKKIFKKAASEKVNDFLNTLYELISVIDDLEPNEFIHEVLNKVSYCSAIKEYDEEGYVERYTNVLELVNISRQFLDINDFINSFTVNRDTLDESLDKVTLSTIHGCKGLEWDAVIIIGLNDEVLPGRSNVEEERRLFYVAMTRAKQYLFLSSYLYEKNKSQANKPTRFIEEINKEYISRLK